MVRIVLPLVLALGLAACEQRAAEAPKPAAAPTPSEWAFGMGKNSVEMVHFIDGDTKNPDLRLEIGRAHV